MEFLSQPLFFFGITKSLVLAIKLNGVGNPEAMRCSDPLLPSCREVRMNRCPRYNAGTENKTKSRR